MLTTSEESTGYAKIRKSRMQLYNFCFNRDHKYLYIIQYQRTYSQSFGCGLNF